MDDAVGVDVERDLDLRHAAGRRRQVDELELAERLVVAGHLPLALEHVDLDRRLHVLGRGEDLGAPGRDGGVALDEARHHAALGLDAERQRGDVEQQDVLDVAAQHAGLDGRADGDDLVGVDRLVRLLAGEVDHEVLHGRHAGRAADEDHVVQVALGDAGVLQRLLERDAAALDEVGRHLLELGPAERLVEVQRAVGRGRDERQVDLRLLDLAELDLGLLGGLLEALGGHAVVGQVDAVGGLELLDEPVDDPLVPVVATERGVAVGRLDLEDAVADLQHRHVERAAAEVEHEDGLVLGLLVEAVGEGRRRRLVDDPQDLEAGDLPGLLGGRALVVVEVRRHRDDRLGDGVTEVALGVALELLEDAGRDLLRRVHLAVDVVALPVLAHVALDRAERAVGVGDGLALGDLADEHLAALGEGDDRRRRARALGVGDDDGVAALEDGDDGVGGTEVDADGLGHGWVSCDWMDANRDVPTRLGRHHAAGNSTIRNVESLLDSRFSGPNDAGSSSSTVNVRRMPSGPGGVHDGRRAWRTRGSADGSRRST